MCKVFQRALTRGIHSFLCDCNVNTCGQQGFLSLRSCLSDLLLLRETVTRLIVDGATVDGVCLNFTIVFHLSNPCKSLLVKREPFVMGQKVLRRIKSCTTGRIYAVQVGEELSQDVRAKRGSEISSIIY